MKTRALTLSALLVAVLAFAGWSTHVAPIAFEPNGKIWVDGTSSLHDWTCEVKQFDGTLAGTTDGGTLASITATAITIPIAQFDCNNGEMNRRMRNALKANEHNSIRFSLANARVGSPNGERFQVETTGRLTIAGTTQQVRFTASGQALSNNRYRLTGAVPITMSQFGISPPTAMLGAVRTGDAVTVNFDVTIRG
jgi:polyisoprenoid-binding protein YceI